MTSLLQNGPARKGALRRGYIALVSGGLVVLILLIGSLMLDVQDRLEALGRASSDNVQWSLSQLEVETALLQQALSKPDLDLAELRERFDIFVSRFQIFEQGNLYEELRRREEFHASVVEYRAFIDWALPLVDGPDPVLRAALPEFAGRVALLRPFGRSMSMAGIDYFTARADRERVLMADTLRSAAWLTTALVVALSVLSFVLFRLNQHSRQQALANADTTTRLRVVVESSVDAILLVDREGTASEFNPAAEEIFGYSREDVIGKIASELLLPPESFDETIATIEARIIDQRGQMTGQDRLETTAMRKDGTRFPVELTIVGTRGPEGELAVVFLRDISDRQQAERELRAARDDALQSERAKAEFLAVMSHEMRTPLNGLLGSLEILSSSLLSPRQKELVEIIETSGNLLLAHVNAVLDVSSSEAGAMRIDAVAFSIEALVAEVVANQSGLAASAGNRIEIVRVSDPVGRVIGDPGRLRQILLNLVGNAVKFTTNGVITVEVDAEPDSGPHRMVEFRVIDSGIGIPEEDLTRIFDDFVTLDRSYGRRVGGTGLGLGITRRIVHAMGGTMGLESELGSGSVFWVRLPFASPGPNLADAPEPGAARAAPKRILVIDDNAINRFVLRTLLEETDNTVAEATDGLEGVAMAEAEAYDVILMDISMPRLDGIEAARRVRQGQGASRGSRIVAVTAHALPEELIRFYEAGMDDCLVKPITRSSLSAILDGRPAPGASPARPDATIDQDTIADLLAHLGANTLDSLLARFLAEGQSTVAALNSQADPDATRQTAHRLTGSAATFGARRLARDLGELDRGLKQGLAVDWEIEGVRATWTDTAAAIALVRARIAHASP